MRRYAGLFAVILVAVALVAAGCQRQQAQQPAPAPQPAAQVPGSGWENDPRGHGRDLPTV